MTTEPMESAVADVAAMRVAAPDASESLEPVRSGYAVSASRGFRVGGATVTADLAAGIQTRRLWKQVAPIVTRIEALPFLAELIDGILDPQIFAHYIRQDDLYLDAYARALATLAARAPRASESRFWASAAATAISAELDIHAELLRRTQPGTPSIKATDVTILGRPSPTTLGYLSFVGAQATIEPYDVGVAAVLPCFWIYAHIGALLAPRAARIGADHPYQAWLALYDDNEFDTATRQAIGILETLLTEAKVERHQRMEQAFRQACIYEWRFWQSAYVLEDWQLA